MLELLTYPHPPSPGHRHSPCCWPGGPRGLLRANLSVVGSVESQRDQNRAQGILCPLCVCPPTPTWTSMAKSLEAQAQVWVHALTVRRPSCLSAGPAGWGGCRKVPPAPRPVGPASARAEQVSEARRPSSLSRADGAMSSTTAPRAPTPMSAPDSPHLLGGTGSRTLPPRLSGPANRGPATAVHKGLRPHAATSWAVGQVLRQSQGPPRGPGAGQVGMLQEPRWREMGHPPARSACSPGGTVLYRSVFVT